MPCDLERIFGSLASALPDVEDQEMVLTPDDLPVVSEDLVSDAVCLIWAMHTYNDKLIDGVWLWCERRTLRLLGLLVLSRVLHPSDVDVTVRVTAPRSELREVVLDYIDFAGGSVCGYRSRVTEFEYWPAQIERHPLLHAPPAGCPAFVLTKSEPGPDTRKDLLTRDRLRISGRTSALLDLATVLLDGGRPDASVVEIDLETEEGFGGAGPNGAEFKVWLPGSGGWDPSMLR